MCFLRLTHIRIDKTRLLSPSIEYKSLSFGFRVKIPIIKFNCDYF